jgi:exodeoxyribonuclease V
MSIELTTDQKNLIQELKKWYIKRDKPFYSYSGPPGSGKTTIIELFIEEMGLEFEEVACAAYVGKAVLLLLRHGLNASTIHSLIYKPIFETINLTEDEGDNVIIKKKSKMKFILKDKLFKKIKLIVIDESSMVNDKLKDDILSFKIPTIFIENKDQLPPVFGLSSIMENPDFVLREIMRQAKDNPIIYLSQCVLNDIPLNIGEYKNSRIINKISLNKDILQYDIIICGKNKTRDKINNEIRENILNINSKDPILGDKLISRQNNWEYQIDNSIFLTNGIIGYITDINYDTIYKGYIGIDFKPEFTDSVFNKIPLDYKYFKTPIENRNSFGMSKYNKFEFGYCITAHLSQGAEYNNVLFIDQPFYDKETTKKLRYTAITRARESITIVKDSYNY